MSRAIEKSKSARQQKAGSNGTGSRSTQKAKSVPITLPDAPQSNSLAQAVHMADSDDSLSRHGIRLGFLIHDVSRLRRAAYDQLMKPLNVTRARWWVLAHLSRHDGMMQSQLADVLEVGKASLGTVIEQLESGGWVERRIDPTDKLAKRVYLSRNAHRMIQTMTRKEDEFNRRILGGLNLDEQKTLIRLLATIKDSLAQMSAAESIPLDD